LIGVCVHVLVPLQLQSVHVQSLESQSIGVPLPQPPPASQVSPWVQALPSLQPEPASTVSVQLDEPLHSRVTQSVSGQEIGVPDGQEPSAWQTSPQVHGSPSLQPVPVSGTCSQDAVPLQLRSTH
jgi:hypothetical protein